MSDKLYDRDGVQLWHGLAENLDFIPDESVDLTVTSPPYNLGASGHKWVGVKEKEWGPHEFYDDTMPENEYQDWQVKVLDEAWRVTKNSGSLFYNHRQRSQKKRGILPWEWIRRTKWEFIQRITWNRSSTHNHDPQRFWRIDEDIYWLCKGEPYFNKQCAKFGTVWTFPFSTNSPHAAPFPEELPTRCILACSKPGDLILDCYVGSGTTVRVASRLGRRAIGVDKEEKYLLEMAIPSLAQMAML
jgi:site-specific DNA-methyltransferase (adenine-specific)